MIGGDDGLIFEGRGFDYIGDHTVGKKISISQIEKIF